MAPVIRPCWLILAFALVPVLAGALASGTKRSPDGEYVVADITDGVVQVLRSLGDAPRHDVTRCVEGALQAEADGHR
jgi:hypothetical protein